MNGIEAKAKKISEYAKYTSCNDLTTNVNWTYLFEEVSYFLYISLE